MDGHSLHSIDHELGQVEARRCAPTSPWFFRHTDGPRAWGRCRGRAEVGSALRRGASSWRAERASERATPGGAGHEPISARPSGARPGPAAVRAAGIEERGSTSLLAVHVLLGDCQGDTRCPTGPATDRWPDDTASTDPLVLMGDFSVLPKDGIHRSARLSSHRLRIGRHSRRCGSRRARRPSHPPRAVCAAARG